MSEKHATAHNEPIDHDTFGQDVDKVVSMQIQERERD